jgi:hypothetical protein
MFVTEDTTRADPETRGRYTPPHAAALAAFVRDTVAPPPDMPAK